MACPVGSSIVRSRGQCRETSTRSQRPVVQPFNPSARPGRGGSQAAARRTSPDRRMRSIGRQPAVQCQRRCPTSDHDAIGSARWVTSRRISQPVLGPGRRCFAPRVNCRQVVGRIRPCLTVKPQRDDETAPAVRSSDRQVRDSPTCGPVGPLAPRHLAEGRAGPDC